MTSMASLVSLLRLLLSPSYAHDGVKASHACQNHGKSLPNYCPIIANLLPRKDHSRAPFPPLFNRIIAMWHRYAGIHHPLFVRLPVSIFVNALKKRPKNSNQRKSL